MAFPIPIPDFVQDKLKELIYDYVTNQLDYVWSYEDKFEELKDAVTTLQNERESVQDKAHEDIDRYGREVYDHVNDWLDDAAKEISEGEKFKEDPEHSEARPIALTNVVIRYNLSKRAEEIKDKVDKLQKRKPDNVDISHWHGPLSTGLPPANVDYVSFASRAKTMEEIKVALEDPNARIIGVCGFSGVGKTTLVIQAAKEALENKLLDKAIMVNVTKIPDIRKIQGQIADVLGIKLEEESEHGRAGRIKQRLMRGENILIILDDVCAKVDLNMLGIPLQNGDDSQKNLILKEGKSSKSHNGKEIQQNPSDVAGPSNLKEKNAFSAAGPSNSKSTVVSSSKLKTQVCDNRCKVLLISEVKQVLTQMDVKEKLILSVNLLEDKEPETLFQKMSGIDNNKSSRFEKLAAEIAKKCNGLPMSIVTTARAVKKQNISVWMDTRQKLEGQNVTGALEYSTKLNYELLETEELKTIFLLCVHMRRDALVADLVKYCIGLGFLKGIYTVRDARGRVQMSLVKLKQSGLLSDSNSSDHFTMQNLVRNAALSILPHVFTMTEGNLDEWPDGDELERCAIISLQRCNVIEKFPESIKCPRLRVFHFENNGSHLEIPNNFFQEMKELRVLILTGIDLSTLPPSIECLTKLRMLCLEQCKLSKKLCIIGKLKNLRILSFSGSDIESLPVELKCLSKLQMFDISNCSKLSKIPANVISSLTCLEELYMRNTRWWVGQKGQNFSLSELRHLNQLTNLELQIPTIDDLPNDLFFDKLYSYKIVIGSFDKYLEPNFIMPEKYDLLRSLAIHQKGFAIHSQKGIKMLFDRVESLLLHKLNGVQDIFYEVNLKGYPHLKHLYIVSNAGMVSLINPNGRKQQCDEELAFPKLESLHLYKLKEMNQICSCASLSQASFAKLKVIKIKLCPKLNNVFSISMVRHLTALETVEVSECNSLKEIVPMPTLNDDETLKFPKLRSLMLQSLSGFIGFYPTSSATSKETPASEETKTEKILFHDKVEVFKLEIMELSSIPINYIWAQSSPPTKKNKESSHFGNLIHLDVKDCGNLEYLMEFSVAKNLHKLQRLFISECDQMQQIFKEEKNGSPQGKNNIFPKLKNLKLSRMGSLRETWNSNFSEEEYHNLDSIIIEECPKLVHVFNCDTTRIFQSLVSLTVKNCKSMKAIFDLADAKQDAEYKVKLQDLHLEMLPKLDHVFKSKKGQGVLKLNNIRKIWLQNCERLKSIFPFDVATTLKKNLESLVVWDCSLLREIVAKGEEANNNTFEFSELATIKFMVLPKFNSFYSGNLELQFPKLKDLSVEHCDILEPFKESTTSNLAKRILFPGKVINKLNSMQIESRHAMLSSSAGIEYRKDNLEDVHMSGIWNIEILYSFLYGCPNLKSLWLNDCSFRVLVPHERFVEIESLGVVPRLKSLNLTNLDRLIEIGFERDAILQRIESLIIKNCPCLNTIVSSSVSLSHLTKLEVVNCSHLKYIMSPATAKSLVQLNTMKIINCYCVEDIVSKQVREEENGYKLSIIFKELKALELVSLENLKSFCRSKTCAFQFPSLEKLVVSACPNLENFSEESNTPTILQKVYTVHEKENRWCWEGNLEATIKYIFHEEKFYEGMVELSVFQYHTELRAVLQRKEDPVKEDVYPNRRKSPLKDWFYSLKTLTLWNWQFKTTYAIPSNVLRRLKSLEELEVRSCSNITVIFEYDMNDTKIEETQLPLKKLTLHDLLGVMHVWQQEKEGKQGILSFKNLQHVSILHCPSLQTVFPVALARKLKMLQKLKVNGCRQLAQIVGKEREADGALVFPRLTKLVLGDLSKLTCFYSDTVGCPELDYLDVHSCCELDPGKLFEAMVYPSVFVHPQQEDGQLKNGPQIDWFYDLKTLKLRKVKFATTYAIPSNILPRLKNLQELEVDDCGDIKFIFGKNVAEIRETPPTNCDELPQIVRKEEEEEEADKPVVVLFPSLTSLKLNLLPNLTGICSIGFTFECPQLDYLQVYSCDHLELFKSKQHSNDEDQDDPPVWWGQLKDEGLQYLSELILDLTDYKNDKVTLPSEILEKKAPNLEKMEINYCKSLKEISLDGMLGNLKRLVLYHLDELHSMDLLKYLPKLKVLRVSSCPRLRTLMHPLAAEKLTYLEELHVAFCESMKEIVERGQIETVVQVIKFERLQRITLERLSSLECFYGGSAKLQLPALIQVEIEDCPDMKSFSRLDMVTPSTLIQVSYQLFGESELVFHRDLNFALELLGGQVFREERLLLGHGDDYPAALKLIWLGEIPLGWRFRNLKYLEVEGCEFLSNSILPSHILPYLNNLQELVVRKCDSVGTIFDVKDTITNSSSMTVIPMKKLTLEQLPRLKHVWNEDPKGRMCLPDLEDVVVSECESIESLLPVSVAKDNLRSLHVSKCGELVEIVAKDEAAATQEENQKLDMFPMLTSLMLWDLPKLSYIIALGMDTLEWPKLRSLDVFGCQKLTTFTIDHSTSDKHSILSAKKVPPNLERLSLTKEDVILIKKRQLHLDLQNIKFLRLCGFSEDSDVFPSDFFSNVPLPNMREFAVANSTFKKIFHPQHLPAMDYTEILSRVKGMELRSLTKLESIGFEKTWMSPLLKNLEVLQVLECTYLRNLVPSTTSVCFSSLSHLNVEDCVGLKYLFTSLTAKSLVKLEKMVITNCESLEVVVHMAERGDNPPDELVEFPKLSDLSLEKLPKLESFYKGKGTNLEPSLLSFLGLTKLNVEDCGALKYLFKSSTAKSLVKLKEMSITNCESLEAVVYMAERGDNPDDQLVKFPRLFYLSLEKLPKLESFYKGKGTNLEPSPLSFLGLTKLNVEDCGALKYLFKSSTAKSLVKLKEMSINNCESLEAVVHMAEQGDNPDDQLVEFPRLLHLSLEKLPKLESFYKGKRANLEPTVMSFSGLIEMNVKNCGLKYLFTSSTAKSLVNLKKMSITNCESLEAVVHMAEHRDNANEVIEFPKLSYLSLEKLPKLKSFSAKNLTLKFPCYSYFSIEIIQCRSMKTFSPGNNVEPFKPWQLKIDGVQQSYVDLNGAVKRSYDDLKSVVEE